MSENTEKARELGLAHKLLLDWENDHPVAIALPDRIAGLLAQARLEEARWWQDRYQGTIHWDEEMALRIESLGQRAGEGGGK